MAKTLEEHYGYLSDNTRLSRYQEAIGRLVLPEHVVLDLGCGTGLLGLMALRAGAAKVIFVEEGAVIGLNARRLETTRVAVEQLQSQYPDSSISAFPCDIADVEEIQASVRRFAEDHSGIDVFVRPDV